MLNWINRRLWCSGEKTENQELSQAHARLITMAVVGMYVLPMSAAGAFAENTRVLMCIYAYAVFYAVVFFYWVRLSPQDFPVRRIFAMVQGYAAMALGLLFGGEQLLPLVAVLLWATVAYGLRYGERYTAACTLLALITILVPAHYNEFWQDHPYMALSLAGTVLLVPAYSSRLIKQLRASCSAAQEASRSKALILAQASHDLRQPIHAISFFTTCLRGSRLGARELEMIDNIDRSVSSASRLFKSLLDVSILDSGSLEPRLEMVRIGDVVQEVINQNRLAALPVGVKLRMIDCDVVVKTDRDILASMLQNLVSNAIKYCPFSDVLLGCRRRSGSLAIEIHDQGPGISTKHQARIFEEFFQAPNHAQGRGDGVGLGLSIVKRQARLIGLDVALTSVEGRGTSIVLQWPPQANLGPAMNRAANEAKANAFANSSCPGRYIQCAE